MRPEHTKNLTLLLGVVLALVVAFVAVRTYMISESASELKPEGSFEMNPQVRATADSLESRMSRLAGYAFEVETDPLRLSRVVIAEEERTALRFRELEEEFLVRLSATVVDEEPKAVVKYKNRSYVVGIGDSLAGRYVVTGISSKRATLVHDGEEIHLEARPMSEQLQYELSSQLEDSVYYQTESPEEF